MGATARCLQVGLCLKLRFSFPLPRPSARAFPRTPSCWAWIQPAASKRTARPSPGRPRSPFPRVHIYFTVTKPRPTTGSLDSNDENCQGDGRRKSVMRSPSRECRHLRHPPRRRTCVHGGPGAWAGGGPHPTPAPLTHSTPLVDLRGPSSACSSALFFKISNYKAAPGFLISHCHVSKWLFSVRPIRKLTHHAVTAANFSPLHVRWIAC